MNHLRQLGQIATIFALACSVVFSQQGRVDTIVDDTTLGPAGGSFNPLLTQPGLTMNNHGDIVFRSGESGQASGLFFYDATSNGFSTVARFGDSIDGNGTLGAVSSARLNDNGDVAFGITIFGSVNGTADNTALSRWSSSTGFATAIREGQIVNNPATAMDVGKTDLQGLFNSGEIGFTSSLDGVSSASNWGAYKTAPGNFNEVYRKGTTYIGAPRVKFNGAGSYAFLGIDSDSVVSLVKDGGVIAQASNVDDDLDFYQFSSNVISENGDVYFTAEDWNSNNHNLYRSNSGGGYSLLAQENAMAAGGTENYGIFAGAGLVTGDDEAAFVNLLSSGNSALFKANGAGSVARIMTEGDSAPDGNGSFGVMNNVSATGDSTYAISKSGVVAFTNTLSGTSGGGADDRGVFLSDGIDIVTAVRDGMSMNGGTVASFLWNGGRESNHQTTTAFNDYGQIAYRAMVGSEWVINTFTPDLHFRNDSSGSWSDKTNWTLSLNPDHVHDVFIDPTSAVIVAGPSAPMTSVNSLQIGGNGGGTLDLISGSTIEALEGTLILVDGALTGNGELLGETISGGVIAPGNSAGTISFEDLELVSSSNLQIELGGELDSEFDRLLVSGDAHLEGDLTISLLGGFALESGMSFDILEVNDGFTGMFQGLADGDLVGNFGGTNLYIDYRDNGVSLLTSVPEPGATWFLIGSMIAVCTRRQRVA